MLDAVISIKFLDKKSKKACENLQGAKNGQHTQGASPLGQCGYGARELKIVLLQPTYKDMDNI